MARLLGPEGLGLYQMALPTLTAVSTLVVSGLPVAASRRMAAQHGRNQAPDGTRNAAMRFAFILSCTLSAGMALAALPLAIWWFRQPDMAWTVLLYAPCVIFQALSAMESAWCYAHGDTQTSAIALLIEQSARIAFIGIISFLWLPRAPSLRVALCVTCLSLAETLALGIQQRQVRKKHPHNPKTRKLRETKALIKEGAPPTAGRFLASLLGALLATMIPAKLIAGGLPRLAAIEALGALTGIVLPMLMLPMIISSAMGTVLIPELARLQAQQNLKKIHLLCRRALLTSVLTASAAGLLLYFCANQACALFGQPGAAGLLRMCVPLLLPMAFHHTTNSLLQGLGRQNQALLGVLVGDALYLTAAYMFTGRTALPMGGYVIGMAVGEVVSCILQGGAAWYYTRAGRYRLL